MHIFNDKDQKTKTAQSVVYTMYVNSSGAENGSYSLTFLGKKVGRRHSVTPAGKQQAWETTVRTSCPEDLVLSSRPEQVPVTTQVLEDLPGSIQELKDERPCSIIHNTQFDKYDDHTAGQTRRQPSPHTHNHGFVNNNSPS